AGAQAIYPAEGRGKSETAFRSFGARWRRQYGAVVRLLEQDLPELLSFCAFPRHLWLKLRTTNVIERCFVEVRRRTRQMVCFVNEPGSSGRTFFWTMLQCSMNFRLRPSLKPSAYISDPCVSPSCALGNPHLQSDFPPAPLISFLFIPFRALWHHANGDPFSFHQLAHSF